MKRTWDEKVTLISADGYEEDELGQQTPIEVETEIWCCEDPVTRNEFYLAGQNNVEVSKILIVHPYEYEGQRYVRFRERKLKVIKTYPISAEELELTCTERIEK